MHDLFRGNCNVKGQVGKGFRLQKVEEAQGSFITNVALFGPVCFCAEHFSVFLSVLSAKDFLIGDNKLFLLSVYNCHCTLWKKVDVVILLHLIH